MCAYTGRVSAQRGLPGQRAPARTVPGCDHTRTPNIKQA